MKQRFKLLTLALALMAGMTMTSCLGDSGDPVKGGYGVITKVNSWMGLYTSFTTPGNNPVTITPTEASVNSYESLVGSGFLLSNLDGQIVSVTYTWNPDLLQFPEGTTEYDGVTLAGIDPLDAPTLVVPGSAVGSANDSVATHPIISLNPQVNGYTYKPYFFDNNRTDIVVPVQYYVPLNSKATSISVSLVYYPDDFDTQADKANGILRLHVNYRVNGVEEFSTQYKSSDITYFYGLGYFYKAFRLSGRILQAWGGSLPSAVNLVADVNEYSTKLDDSQTKRDQVYPVLTYEEYADELTN